MNVDAFLDAEDLEGTLYRLDIPLLTPFDTASGRVAARTVALVSVARDGHTGWGEAAPYPGQDESFEEVVEAARRGVWTPTLAAAIDEAVCDRDARERGVALAGELGDASEAIPISIAVGMGHESISRLESATESGVTRVKVKIMPGRTGHVAEIRDRFPDLVIGVDGNGSFDESNRHEILALGNLNIAYVEQPFASLRGVEVERLADAGLAVFADESVRIFDDAKTALETPGVAGVVIKPGRLGWRTSVAVVKAARAAGKRWRASGLLETGVGRAFTEALASAPDAYISDVAPAEWFFAYDIVESRASTGHIAPSGGYGSGIEVRQDIVESLATAAIRIRGSAIQDPG